MTNDNSCQSDGSEPPESCLSPVPAFAPMAKFATESHHRHFHPPAIRAAARLVDRVFGRRPHSPLPLSGHANHSVEAATPARQKRKTVSVGQSTNTRFASPHTRRHTAPKSYIIDSTLLNNYEG